MGPADKMPAFREFGWVKNPSHAFKILEVCNFAQAIEGGLDMAHAPILHRRLPITRRGLPLVGIIDGFRWCIVGGDSPIYLPGFALSLGVIAFMLWAGIFAFRRIERGFADLI